MARTLRTALCLALFTHPLACGEAGDDDGVGGAGGKGDDLADSGICAGKVLDKSVGDDGDEQADLSELGDVFARLVLNAEGDPDTCPTTYGEIMAKLREVDTEGCSGPQDGIRSAVVSETAQVMGKADSYRVVTTRECGGRSAFELLFSTFGVTSTQKTLSGNVEVIAFDSTKKLFNYYEVVDGEISHFGDSTQYMTAAGDLARCQNCHPSGMLNMKELDAPWLHWEGDPTTPGASALIDKHEDLGTKTDGIELEGIVLSGNDAIMDVRAKTLLATNDLEQVLRPLFCTMQINLESASSSPNSTPSSIPGSALVDSRIGFGSVTISKATYDATLKAAKQMVVGNNGAQLKNKSGKGVVDTHFPFSFPSVSREDQSYIDKLIELKVIDEDFKQDVLSVDMTRPLFSDDRCALLESAPSLGKLTTSTGKAIKSLPKKIREGFASKLKNSPQGSPGAQLAGFLADTKDQTAHSAAVDAFFTACSARPEAEFFTDANKVVSLRRAQSRELPVMEFPATLPTDSLDVPSSAKLNPTTCVLEQ
jgi:hypothetical protein